MPAAATQLQALSKVWRTQPHIHCRPSALEAARKQAPTRDEQVEHRLQPAHSKAVQEQNHVGRGGGRQHAAPQRHRAAAEQGDGDGGADDLGPGGVEGEWRWSGACSSQGGRVGSEPHRQAYPQHSHSGAHPTSCTSDPTIASSAITHSTSRTVRGYCSRQCSARCLPVATPLCAPLGSEGGGLMRRGGWSMLRERCWGAAGHCPAGTGGAKPSQQAAHRRAASDWSRKPMAVDHSRTQSRL